MDPWRIDKIKHDQFKNTNYLRIYGWGWLSPIGLFIFLAGVIGLAINVRIDDSLLARMSFFGFVIIWIGIFMNGVSEIRSMVLLDTKCLDVQVKKIGVTIRNSASWATRALVEYEFNGEIYKSTPMPDGYATFGSEKSATKFSNYLLHEKNLKIYVDPKHPKRSIFYDLNAG